jgi:hypothetical protein
MAKRDEVAVVFQLDHSRYKAYLPPLKVSGIGLHPTRRTHPLQKARRVGHPAPGYSIFKSKAQLLNRANPQPASLREPGGCARS